jgi:NAD(P)-dependent dehydrogenase (short-subunit alcohol dehydrogenase family)
MFYLVKAAHAELKKRKGRIINTTSVTAYRGSPELVDYSATKGAITAFTRSLSGMLVDDGIRVNAVAPGPIWTPLIPSSFDAEKVSTFGADTPMKRAGQPYELTGAYVFLASADSSYVTGQVIHVNGGEIVNA